MRNNNMKENMKQKAAFSLLGILLFLFIACFPALQVSAQDVDVTQEIRAEGTSPIGQVIADELNRAGDGSGSFVKAVKFDRESGIARVSYQAAGNGEIVLRFYSDRDLEEEQELLYTAPAVPVSATSGEDMIDVALDGFDIPEYFILEADCLVDGEPNTNCIYEYTEAIVTLDRMTPADFPEGYFVYTDRSAGLPGAGENDPDPESPAGNFVVYNEKLILLQPGTAFETGEDSAVFSLTEIQDQHPDLTEAQLTEAFGFAVRGETVGDDVFMLTDREKGGVRVQGDQVTVPVRAPEMLNEMYTAINLSASEPVSPNFAERTVQVNTDWAKGKVSYTPLLDYGIKSNKGLPYVWFNLGNSGSFDLDLGSTGAEPTDDGQISTDAMRRLDIDIPGYKDRAYGFGYSISFDLYVGASGDANIKGSYGIKVYFSVGLNGVKHKCENRTVQISEVTPAIPNKTVDVAFRWKISLNLEGGVIDVLSPDEFQFGPIVTLTAYLAFEGRATATLNKADAPLDPKIKADILHTCIYPDSVGDEKCGCIDGMISRALFIGCSGKLDLYFKKIGFNLDAPIFKESPPDVDYFYHSLKFGDYDRVHGKPIECPHKYYRFSVLTWINRLAEVGAVVSTDADTKEWSWNGRNITDIKGIVDPLYLNMDQVGKKVSAVTHAGVPIAEAAVTYDDLHNHNTILLQNNYANLISELNLEGFVPRILNGVKQRDVYEGTNVNTPDITMTGTFITTPAGEGSRTLHENDIGVSVQWDNEFHEGRRQYTVGDVSHATITVNFADFDGGKWVCSDRLLNYTTFFHGIRYARNAMISTRIAGKPVTGYVTFSVDSVKIVAGKNKNGDLIPGTAVEVRATFMLPNVDDQYCLVHVKNGLSSCGSHFYRVGETAIAVSRAIADTRGDIVMAMNGLELSTWSDDEKEKLRNDILYNYADPELTLRQWMTSPKDKLEETDLIPIRTADGITYAGVLFVVPDADEVELTAAYGSPTYIKAIYADIVEPVPGEFFSEEKYQTDFVMITDPRALNEYHYVRDVNPDTPGGKVRYTWYQDGEKAEGKIEYNTEYVAEATVKPIDRVAFRYPLGSDNGTKAYINKHDETDHAADEFEPALVPYGAASFRRVFKTRKANLLEIYQPSDLYYPVGIDARVINAYLKQLRVDIRTEDVDVNSAETIWHVIEQSEIPGAGESFEVPCEVILPDEIENELGVDLHTKVVIHIFGGDELLPPIAEPGPGTYARDLDVQLRTIYKDADILYYYYQEGHEPEEPAFELFDSEKPIELSRVGIETTTWVIRAKVTKGGKESALAEFVYRLVPAEKEYWVTVLNGEGKCSYTGGVMFKAPVTEEISLMPYAFEGMLFDHWEVLDGPEDFPWVKGTGPSDEFPVFAMPPQDVVVEAKYKPDTDVPVITDIQMIMTPPEIGQPLPDVDEKSSHKVIIGGSEEEDSIVIEVPAAKIQWIGVDPGTIVERGKTYTLAATYDIPTMRTIAPDDFKRIEEKTEPNEVVFCPSANGTINDDLQALVRVEEDLDQATLYYTFDFRAKFFYVLYDANGGDLDEVPPLVIEIVGEEAVLTDKKPVAEPGRRFLGWSEDPEAADPTYVYNEEDPPVFTEDITLYAVWQDYQVELLWLDYDNKDKTRGKVTVIADDTDSIIADGADPAITKDEYGVGHTFVSFHNLPYSADGHTVKLEEEKDGYLSLGKDGKDIERLYQVSYKPDDEHYRATITLTAARRFRAEKEWDIDIENKDRPDSVPVILQSSNVKRAEKSLTELLKEYILHGTDEDREAIIEELEKITGVSLRGLSPEEAFAKAAALVIQHKLSMDNVSDALKELLKPDTNDSKIQKDGKEITWWAHQLGVIKSEEDWKYTFEPVIRYIIEKSETDKDGKLHVTWKEDAEWRVVEKSGKSPVEPDGTAKFKVPAYTSVLTEKEVKEHNTLYQVSYESKGDNTVITNLAVEDHSIEKYWIMLNGAKKPENVFVLLMWQYDEEYLNAATEKKWIEFDGYKYWLPELNPISGDIASLADVLDVISPDWLKIIPKELVELVLKKVKIPMALCVLNEKNEWHASFRVKKYDSVFGLPLKRRAAEICSAICQAALQYFLHINIPIGFNPIQGFVSYSKDPIPVDIVPVMLDPIVNAWIKTDPSKTITGVKYWDDNKNEDGIRPDSITLHLWEDGVKHVKDIVVRRSDNLASDAAGFWTWSYDKADKNKKYTVTEDPVPGYTTEINGIDVVNHHKTEKRTLSGRKIWDDRNNARGLRPDSVTIHLLADGQKVDTFVVSGRTNWKWSGVYPTYSSSTGKKIVYSVLEDEVPAYTTTYSGLDVTNMLDPVITVEIVKQWRGTNATYPKTPVKIHLKQNGQPYGAPVTLNDANGWEAVMTDVPKIDGSGKVYNYTVLEETVPDGFTVRYAYRWTDGGTRLVCTVTNAHGEKTLTGHKYWDDEDDVRGLRPESVTIHLLADGKQVDTFTVSADTDWTWSGGYPVIDPSNGKEIVYSIQEEDVPEYLPYYSGLDVTNVLISILRVKIVKKWKGTNEDYPERPVDVQLLQNGKPFGPPISLNAENQWTANISYVPREDDDGETYRYTIVETPVPDGFAAEYTYRREDGGSRLVCTVTNTHDEKILTGHKVWDDDNDRLGKRPSLVEFMILANGQMVDRKMLTADTGWMWQGAYPEKDKDGVPIKYSVLEMPVPYYTPVYSADDPLSVTNVLGGSDLTVSCHLVNGNPERSFGYTIALEDEAKQPWKGTLPGNLNGNDTLITFTDGKTLIFLKDGEYLTLWGIPDGWRYTVRPVRSDGYVAWVIDEANENKTREGNFTKNAGKRDADDTNYPEWTTAVKQNKADNRADFYRDLGVIITGLKTVNGNPPSISEEGLFTFALYDGQKTELARAFNGEEGSFGFEVRLGRAAECTYTVAELNDSDISGRYILDTTPRDVHITLTDDTDPHAPTVIVEPEIVKINNRTKSRRVPFTFTKKWVGVKGKTPKPKFTLYKADGTVARTSQPSSDGKNPTTYTYWLKDNVDYSDYYVKEEFMPGYITLYKNTKSSGHEDETERAYNHGTITNERVPPTGDHVNTVMLLLLMLAAALGIGLAWNMPRHKKKSER